jgi:hypothetical protein
MGVRPERVAEILPGVRDIVDFIKDYAPPPFPGRIDNDLARRGQALFEQRCAGCHGDYSPIPEVRLESYPNAVIPVERIGTDPVRWASATGDLAQAIQDSGAGPYLSVGPTAGYVPPPLTGVWATAPYFHNGSVPTIWHVLHPDSRPERFEVGGHRLDFEKLGIAGEARPDGSYRDLSGYTPWSTPSLYDTRLPGQDNSGHAGPLEGLSESEKWALLEYLKLL